MQAEACRQLVHFEVPGRWRRGTECLATQPMGPLLPIAASIALVQVLHGGGRQLAAIIDGGRDRSPGRLAFHSHIVAALGVSVPAWLTVADG